MVYIILVLSFLLDGVLSNFLSYLPNQLSYFVPMFTLVCIILSYPSYKKNHKNYFLLVSITGFLYDLFYTNLLFTNIYLFLLIAYITTYIYHKITINIITSSLIIMVLITFYNSVYALLLTIFNVVPITFYDILYQILHSLILNIIYGQIIYFTYKIFPGKRRLN